MASLSPPYPAQLRTAGQPILPLSSPLPLLLLVLLLSVFSLCLSLPSSVRRAPSSRVL